MLTLDRKVGESIIIGDNLITIKILKNDRGRVRVGIDAPKTLSVHREELYHMMKEKEDDPDKSN